MKPEYFKQEAKTIVDGFFDAKLFKEEITRDDMNRVQTFIAEMMQMKFEFVERAKELHDEITKEANKL